MSENNERVPVIIGNALPFRLVVRETDNWSPSLDEINSLSYDYVRLHRLSTNIDIGIRPYSMGVAFDGSLILPATKKFLDKDLSLDLFNRALGFLLLGGVYTEAVSSEDISVGTMTLDGYFRSESACVGSIANFHFAIQSKLVGVLDSIKLLNPEEIKVKDYEDAISLGKRILSSVPKLSASILLNGVTYFVKHQWPESLVSLWAAIEQVLSHVWDVEIVLKRNDTDGEIIGRKKFLQDFRTWSTSTKIEVLYQKGLIDLKIYEYLNIARKSRNNFVHDGEKPKQKDANSALNALFQIISLCGSDYTDKHALDGILKIIGMNVRGELISNRKTLSEEEVAHWLPIPPIPGDAQWGEGEYEIIEELRLKEIDS